MKVEKKIEQRRHSKLKVEPRPRPFDQLCVNIWNVAGPPGQCSQHDTQQGTVNLFAWAQILEPMQGPQQHFYHRVPQAHLMATTESWISCMTQVAASTTQPSSSQSNAVVTTVARNPPQRKGGTKVLK
ncbi:hypothetical protein KIN20_023329, partial [Parelaphostrongylus tenuis]